MDSRPGGYLAGFDRKQFRFDSSIHWLNNCGPDGWVSKVFEIIGHDYPKAKKQRHIRRFLSDKFNYLVSNNPDELKDQWMKEFPQDKKGIIRFFKDAKKLSKSFNKYVNLSRTTDTMGLYRKLIYGLKMLDFALPFLPHIRYSGDEGMNKGLSKYFKSSQLKDVFHAEPDLLSCLIPISWAYSDNFQTPPTGGSQRYAEWLVHVSKTMGGDVFLKSKVKEIILKNNKAIGVKVDSKGSEKELYGRYIVAASDAESLYKKLLPNSESGLKMIEKLDNAKMYASGLSVSIGLDCHPKDLGFGEENIYFSDTGFDRKEYSGTDISKSGMHIIASSIRDHTLAPKGKGTLTLFVPAWIDSYENWGCEKDINGEFIRGVDYQRIKHLKANILIDRVQEKIAPELRKHIEYYDVATPITLLRYTGNKNGSMMGQRPGKENMKAKIASYRTPISNVLQSGHWADLGGGILIAMKSAVNTSLIILKKEKPEAFKVLAKYMDGEIEIGEVLSSDFLRPYDNSWIPQPTPAQKAENPKEK